MGDLVEIDSFTVGGTRLGPSMPGTRLQQMLGSRIGIDIVTKTLQVPTKRGIVIAKTGDRIVLLSDNSLEVEHGTCT